MKKTKQTIPKWFDGVVYQEGTTVRNPFSGESYKLNALELSIYDMIIGAQTLIDIQFNGDMLNPKTAGLQREMRKGLDWFIDNNAKAYMVLLD